MKLFKVGDKVKYGTDYGIVKGDCICGMAECKNLMIDLYQNKNNQISFHSISPDKLKPFIKEINHPLTQIFK